MKEKRLGSIGQAVILILAAICLLAVVLSSNQASMSILLPQSFTGEYSWDGEEWFPLDNNAQLSALDGNLILRGHFSFDMSPGQSLSYYRNHIGLTLYINGALCYEDSVVTLARDGVGLMPSMCGQEWSQLYFPDGLTEEDEVEIHLYNPHAHGNASAYRDFLNTLYDAPSTANLLEQQLAPYSRPFQVAGLCLIVSSLMLLGAATAAALQRLPVRGMLLKLGLLLLFAGGYFFFDIIDLSFHSRLVVLNTYGRQLCMMLFVLWLGLCQLEHLTGNRRKLAWAAVTLSGALDAILIVISFTGVTVIYDTGFCWAVSQVVLCPLLLACSLLEFIRGTKDHRMFRLPYVLLYTAILLDLAGVGASMYSHGTCTKIAFSLLFILFFVRASIGIITNHQASIRAEKLEKELEDSRTAVMLSQMQPHFLYNILNTIYHLCGREPEIAQEAISNFSDYLRNNLDSLGKNEPISFDEELQHVQTYLELEKIRFGDELVVVYNIEASRFFLPALTVQPMVENAVKHGIAKKRGGGMVSISTQERPNCFEITVSDTGVGFDPEHYEDDGRPHVGIRNVRQRLQYMSRAALEITSVPGEGTTVVIRIPKEEGQP